MRTSTDRIEKKVLLHASRGRVWKALADSGEFGSWFGIRFDGPFTPGATVHGVIVGTMVDADVAKAMKAYEGLRYAITIERMEPERLLSYRWHPHAMDPGVDYSHEPTTLVVFELEDAAGGTMLTVTESGFDAIPVSRRAGAFQANEQGWIAQLKLIEKYLDRAA